MRTLGFLMLVLLPLMFACPKQQQPEPDTSEAITWHQRMQDHLTYASGMREAVIQGDLDLAKEHATRLGAYPQPQYVPELWRDSLERLYHLADQGAGSESLIDAAIVVGRLAEACGDCHSKTGAQPKFSEIPEAPEGDNTLIHMLRHRSAALSMWQGLAFPSEVKWTTGAAQLKEEPLQIAEEGVTSHWTNEVVALDERVHGLADRAINAPREEWVEVYADTLSACADCHAVTRVIKP